MRWLSVCAVLCVGPLVCRADDPPPTETVIRFNVRPMAAPKPALKYQLLPELREMNPGNPIQGYLTCFMEQTNFFHNKEFLETREKWLTMPLNELPLKELRNNYSGGGPLGRADYAARLDTPDWQVLLKLKREGINLLLPEFQELRNLSGALKVRFRGEVAERRFDDALATAKTIFALSRHMADHPTFIANLVAIAVALQGVGPLEEMIQQPGCPNQYWALTNLPTPFIDLRKGQQGERALLDNVFVLFTDKEPMSDEQIKRAVDSIRVLLKVAQEGPGRDVIKGDPAEWVAAQAKDEVRVAAARKRLIEAGLDADKAKQFPAQQVILLDEKLEYEIQVDEAAKMTALPYWEVDKLRAAVPQGKREERLLAAFAPAYLKVRQAAARLDQRFAMLRCIEALRIHAAENDGKLPAKLSDVKLPLPMDPISGKAFRFDVDGNTATLRGAAPAGQEKNAPFNLRYEITIAM